MMDRASASAAVEDGYDPSFIHAIEEVILLGKPSDIDLLLNRLVDDDRLIGDLRYGLESLRYFRLRYGNETSKLSEDMRKNVLKFDTELSSRLLQILHDRRNGLAEERA